MRMKRPHVASPDEIRITRKGETAVIEYADPDIWATHFTIGPKLAEMTDAEVLQMWNDCIAATDQFRREHPYVATEIPIGKPQVEKSELTGRWVPRGDVRRCVVHDGGRDGEPVVDIDDRELSWEEFGELLTSFAGWGMRLVFVPNGELHDKPRIRVREPNQEPPPKRTGRRVRG